jgi:Amidohydrolase family
VDAYKALDVFPSLFPMHTFYWGDWHREHTLGPVLADNISPTGWYLQRGMAFSSHHDAPVAFPDSMRVLSSTVTRRSRSGDILGPEHRVPVVTALKAMTIWPAWSQFEDADKGTIEAGKLADFVILSTDPTAVDPETLSQLRVIETIKEGETVFRLDEKAQKKTDLQFPNGRSRDTFAAFLRAAAADREFRRLPENRQNQFHRSLLNAAMHGGACVTPLLTELAAAMVGEG